MCLSRVTTAETCIHRPRPSRPTERALPSTGTILPTRARECRFRRGGAWSVPGRTWGGRGMASPLRVFGLVLNHHRRSHGQEFCRGGHHHGCREANANHGVCAERLGFLDHAVQGLLSAMSFAYSWTSPPTTLRRPAIMSLPRCRARTVLPRARPSVLTMRFPGTVSVVTTIMSISPRLCICPSYGQ